MGGIWLHGYLKSRKTTYGLGLAIRRLERKWNGLINQSAMAVNSFHNPSPISELYLHSSWLFDGFDEGYFQSIELPSIQATHHLPRIWLCLNCSMRRLLDLWPLFGQQAEATMRLTWFGFPSRDENARLLLEISEYLSLFLTSQPTKPTLLSESIMSFSRLMTGRSAELS